MPDASPLEPRPRRLPFPAAALAVYLAAALFLFGETLLQGRSRVISAQGLDVTAYFLPMHGYGFSELRAGRVPHWNPYVFSGTPFLANPQAAVFYPVNWLHLLLPAATAINWGFAIHFVASAWFTALWARDRGSGAAGAILGGLVYVCSGQLFLHLIPGHVTMLAALTWSPLLLLAVDRMLARPEPRAAGPLAVLAITMALLAGHPQTPYYALLGATLYIVCRRLASPDPSSTDARWKQIARPIARLAGYAAVAGLIASVQLLPSAFLLRQSLRGGGLTDAFASAGSLPPENFLTLVLPHPWGDRLHVTYDGREIYWEVGAFVGAAALLIAYFAVVAAPRRRWPEVAVVAAAFLVALGANTPLLDVLRRIVPLFSIFRGPVHFAQFGTLFLAVLAAHGCDALLSARLPVRLKPALVVLAGAGVLAVVGWTHAAAPGAADRERFLARDHLVTAAFALAAAGAAVLPMRNAAFRLALPSVAAAQLLAFAWHNRVSSPPAPRYPKKFAEAGLPPPPNRLLHGGRGADNAAMYRRALDATGYDPIALRRYARFLALAQGDETTSPNWVPPIVKLTPVLSMLRVVQCHMTEKDKEPEVVMLPNPFPHAFLAGTYLLADSEPAAADLLRSPAFSPRGSVILESPPPAETAPSASRDGTISATQLPGGAVEIRATLPQPAIAVITDSYAQGWTARSISPGGGPYQVMPADLTLCAIPLAAGQHHLVMEYKTQGLVPGAAITFTTLAVSSAAFLRADRRRRAPQPAHP